MKNKLYEEMYQKYSEGYSLSEVGKMFGMTRQSVYSGFKRRNYKLRKKKKLPFITYKGVKFTLRNHGYYSRTDGDRELMHRFVWVDKKGEIPKGYDIHHVDGDKTNNDIKNLECITKEEHTRKYSTNCNQHKCNCKKHGKINRQT